MTGSNSPLRRFTVGETRARWARGLLGALLVTLPGTALADPMPAAVPTEEQIQAARAPYREARELHRQGRLKEALERALEAYRIASTPVTAVEAGHLLVEAGRLVEARDVVRSVTLFPVSPRESDKGREARQEAASLGASLDARIPKVAFVGRPAGVDVVLDGKPFAATDATAWLGLDPGAHAIAVRAGDRTCTTINVTLSETEARTIDLHDVAATCHSETAPATSPEPATAPPPQPLSPLPSTAQRAAVPPPPPPAPEASSSSAGWRWAGAVIAGAGVVAIGAGGGVALAAKSNYDSVASECPAQGCTLSAYNVRNNARSQADAATVVMAVGGAAIAGGVLLVVFAPGSHAHGSDASRATVGFGLGNVQLAVPF